MNNKRLAIVDLDSMLHLVAYNQWFKGNRTNVKAVKQHIHTFYNTIKVNSRCTHVLPVFQNNSDTFRKEILKEYKAHRKPLEWITHWKPTILEIFDELGGIALGSLESDDAQSILAKDFGYRNTVIVSNDKDMFQVPGTHYNPYKANLKEPGKWRTVTPEEARYELFIQVITGDPTDMPGSLCGVEGVARKTAVKLIGSRTDYENVVREAYTKKYGKESFKRANLTYKLVRLLTGEPDKDKYAPAAAKIEVNLIKTIYRDLIKPINNTVESLFNN